MYLQFEFGLNAGWLLIKEQVLDSLDRMQVLTNKNVDDICNVMRKPGSQNANQMPDRGQIPFYPIIDGDAPLIKK